MKKTYEIKCTICGKRTTEYCHNLVCRACHRSETLEDFDNNVQVNELRRARGLPELT